MTTPNPIRRGGLRARPLSPLIAATLIPWIALLSAACTQVQPTPLARRPAPEKFERSIPRATKPAPRSLAEVSPEAPPVSLAPPPASLAPDTSTQPFTSLSPMDLAAIPDDDALTLARVVFNGEAPSLDAHQRERVARAFANEVLDQELEPLLVLALIAQESRFDPVAVGPRGSLGLMQVRPFVGEDVAARHGLVWFGNPTLFDPVQNVRIGTRYFAEMIRRFATVEQALGAYNMGPTRLRRILNRGDDWSQNYVEGVRRNYETLHRRYAPAVTDAGG